MCTTILSVKNEPSYFTDPFVILPVAMNDCLAMAFNRLV
jgi:hypothetical protein